MSVEPMTAFSSREITLVRDAIARFDLDLRGYAVFTEAATGAFRWTPLIALLSGARRVIAITKDSRYGPAAEIARGTQLLAEQLGCADRLTIVDNDNDIADAEIVTNLGFVRPLDRRRVAKLKPTAVIPLMCETWEHRSTDLDLRACAHRGVLVLGTNERHPDLGTFEYVGAVALKLLFEAGVEVVRSRVLVVSSGHFATAICETLCGAGASVRLATDVSTALTSNSVCSTPFASLDTRELIRCSDAVVFAEHLSTNVLVGAAGRLTVDEFVELNPHIRVAHISGLIDAAGLRRHGIRIEPVDVASAARTMSVTTAYVGPRPVVDLHTAGLRVGQAMAAARVGIRTTEEARLIALEHPLCQDFSGDQLDALEMDRGLGIAN